MRPKIRYKLTDQKLRTYGGFQWTPGVWAPLLDGGGSLCNAHWYHTYSHPLLAVALNPISGNIKKLRLWKCQVRGKSLDDHGLKQGWTQARLRNEVPVPVIPLGALVRWAIYCSLELRQPNTYRAWAGHWLDGTDRSRAASAAATRAAEAEIWEAAGRNAARQVPSEVAEAAGKAAWEAAGKAAREAARQAAQAARGAAGAAAAVEAAVRMAAAAAWRAAVAKAAAAAGWRVRMGQKTPINLLALLKRAIRDEAVAQQEIVA